MLLTQLPSQQQQEQTIVDQQIGFHTTTQQLLFNPLLNTLPFNNNRNNKRPFSSLFSDNDPFTAALHTSNNSSSQQQTKTTLPQKKRINNKKPRVYTSAAYLAKFPNPNRSSSQIDCGEDAFFINHYHGDDENDENDEQSNNNHTRPTNKRRRIMSMGVSDGVGGYSRWVLNGKRVDPSEMAWALMDISKQQLSSSSLVCKNSLMTPKQALIHAYNDIIDNEKVSIGGATACIVALDQVYLDHVSTATATATAAEMDDDTSSHNIQLTANVVEEDAGVVVSGQSAADDDDDNSNNGHDHAVMSSLKHASSSLSSASADQKNSNNTQQQRHAALKLSSANLGDSAFYVIRDGAVFYRSTDQTHYFNCPYQLSAPRESLPNILQDHPNMADEMIESLTILSNDVIIVASDGLTDNVFDEEVARIVLNRMNQVETKKENDVDENSDSTEEEKKNDESKTSMELKDVAQAIAHDILHRAVLVSRSTDIETPFQKYSALHGLDFPGGKPDDITVCVCVVE